MLALTDAELEILTNLARPLTPNDRTAFLEACAELLTRVPERGVGITFQIARDLQRQFSRSEELRDNMSTSRRQPQLLRKIGDKQRRQSRQNG